MLLSRCYVDTASHPPSLPHPTPTLTGAVGTPGSAQWGNSPKVPLSPAAQGLQGPKVFLLSMFELGKYDFHLLEVDGGDLGSHRRHAFLVAS